MPEDASVLTVEYKINLLAPADGKIILARGTVIRDGRTLKIARGEVFCGPTGSETLCAEMLNTVMTLHGRADLDRQVRPR
jgi:acyl-coenzyme A thioesterase PaaI-like protein